MKHFQTIFVLLICGVSVFVSGCGSGQISSREQKAITIAQNALREHKLKLEDFDPPKVHYDTNDQHWGVTFWPKSRVVDGDVFVVIDDKTGKIISASQGLAPLQ
jgi:hypothetical protein